MSKEKENKDASNLLFNDGQPLIYKKTLVFIYWIPETKYSIFNLFLNFVSFFFFKKKTLKKMLSVLFIVIAFYASIAYSVNVTHISECPSLSSRTAPTSVHDLRADDVKVMGALGDR